MHAEVLSEDRHLLRPLKALLLMMSCSVLALSAPPWRRRKRNRDEAMLLNKIGN